MNPNPPHPPQTGGMVVQGMMVQGAPPANPSGAEDPNRIKMLLDLCFDDGLFPESEIEFGVTEIIDGVGVLTLSEEVNMATINWLKARTVIVVFDEPAMSISVAQREQLIRIYEDAWYLEPTVNPSQKRGHTHGEGPNITCYIARNARIAEWMIMKSEDMIPTRNGAIKGIFKPWMTKQEIDEMRDNDAAERKVDARLLLQFMAERELTDSFRQMHPEDPGFTWFSNQQRENQPMARRRLDLMLARGAAWEAMTEVLVDTTYMLDHKPVLAILRLGGGLKKEAGFFRLNTENLKNPAVLDWCKRHWEDWEKTREWFASEEEWVQLGFRMVTRALDAFSRILAKQRNREEQECLALIEEVEDQMGRDPLTNIYWERRRINGVKKLEIIQIEQQEAWAKRARERGMAQVDRMTKDTFHRLCPPHSHSKIRALQHPFNAQADLVVTTEAMSQFAAEYYLDILTSRRPPEESLVEMQNQGNMWQHTSEALTQQQRLSLDRPFTLEELKEATKSMARGKSPGDDGLLVEFFEATWGQVGPILLSLFNKVLEGGRLTEDMCRGVITLLYKKGDKLNVRNWRPISLLNVAYKILAKALSRRLGQFLPDLVKSDQGAFVKGRSIAENIMVAMGALEVIGKEKRQVLVSMLDLEKAYDRVNWSFVLTTLEHMSFGVCSRRWVAGMYKRSTATVLVNGKKSQEFALTRSLRQGCPLAPLLFVLQIEVVLNATRSNRLVKGLELREEVKTGAIANDLLLITEATSESMGAAKGVLDMYADLSEAKVN
ncbi:hypothetical protein CBR_g23241 [Chara braunii]|uniref:Reverse transcriptase domain-containing protein n=1 Tax=Chara braunii TaxID=69332 RepID=A0A388JV95_CHABU|nr:hypothetical protein CBR_g23241 [Chara braunii]|eukprot:GBG61726.1 hypothetical protein CBR_g23241 [Chara braunii]